MLVTGELCVTRPSYSVICPGAAGGSLKMRDPNNHVPVFDVERAAMWIEGSRRDVTTSQFARGCRMFSERLYELCQFLSHVLDCSFVLFITNMLRGGPSVFEMCFYVVCQLDEGT